MKEIKVYKWVVTHTTDKVVELHQLTGEEKFEEEVWYRFADLLWIQKKKWVTVYRILKETESELAVELHSQYKKG